MVQHCAKCGEDITYAKATGISSIYSPEEEEFLLCEPCFFREDDLIEEKGTNNLPEELKKYKLNLQLARKRIPRKY